MTNRNKMFLRPSARDICRAIATHNIQLEVSGRPNTVSILSHMQDSVLLVGGRGELHQLGVELRLEGLLHVVAGLDRRVLALRTLCANQPDGSTTSVALLCSGILRVWQPSWAVACK